MGMLPSYMSLIAAAVRSPEVILVFVGPVGWGKNLLHAI